MRRGPTRRVVQRVSLDGDSRDGCGSAAIRLDAFVRIVTYKVIFNQLCTRNVLQVYPMPMVTIRSHPAVVIRQIPVELRIRRRVICAEPLCSIVYDAVYDLNVRPINRKSIRQWVVKGPRLTCRTTYARRGSLQSPIPRIRAIYGENIGIGSRLQCCPLTIVVPHDNGRTGGSCYMADKAVVCGTDFSAALSP